MPATTVPGYFCIAPSRSTHPSSVPTIRCLSPRTPVWNLSKSLHFSILHALFATNKSSNNDMTPVEKKTVARLAGSTCSVGAAILVLITVLFFPGQSWAQAGLVAAYAFNEGAGTTVTDISGNGNTGTISGATWTTSGKFGNALLFDGSSARVTVPNATSLRLTTGMTLEAWVYPTVAPTGWRAVVDKNIDGYYLMASTDVGNQLAGRGTWTAGNTNTIGPPHL